MQELREIGYLPEAVRNYLALLGWGYDAETTFFTTEDLIEKFSLERVSRSPAVFDEQKLSWMNGHYIREMDTAELTRRVAEWMSARDMPGADDPRLEQAVAAVKDKVSTLAEVPRLVGFAFGPVETDQKAWDKVMGKEGARDLLERAREALAGAEPFDEAQIEAALQRVVEETGAKPGAVYQPLRVAITGKTVSAGIFESLALLERDEALQSDRRRARPALAALAVAKTDRQLRRPSCRYVGWRWRHEQQGSAKWREAN